MWKSYPRGYSAHEFREGTKTHRNRGSSASDERSHKRKGSIFDSSVFDSFPQSGRKESLGRNRIIRSCKSLSLRTKIWEQVLKPLKVNWILQWTNADWKLINYDGKCSVNRGIRYDWQRGFVFRKKRGCVEEPSQHGRNTSEYQNVDSLTRTETEVDELFRDIETIVDVRLSAYLIGYI